MERDLPIGGSGGHSPTVDVFTPVELLPGPAVIVLHGAAGRREDMTQFAVALAGEGHLVVNASWRLPPDPAHRTSGIRRLHRAVALARQRIEQPAIVVAWSDSAMVAVPAVQGRACNPTDIERLIVLGGYFGWEGEVPATVRTTAAEFFGEGDPTCWRSPFGDLETAPSVPIDVVVGDLDVNRSHGVAFADAARMAGWPVALHVVHECDHYELVTPRLEGGARAVGTVSALVRRRADGAAAPQPTQRESSPMNRRGTAARTAGFIGRYGSDLAGRLIVTVDDDLTISPCVEPGPNRVLLVAGVDRDVGGRPVVGRADAILLVIVIAGQPIVDVVAIPRDVAVGLAVGMQRLGWAIEYGGLRSLVDAVTDLTGLHVDHVVAVDGSTLARAVDALGGIDVDLPAIARDRRTGVDLVAGSQRLSGSEAVAYVRSRVNDSDAPGAAGRVLGDEGRRMRLQIVAQGLRRRWASAGSVRRLRTVWTLRGRLLVNPAFPREAIALAKLVSASSLQFTELATRPLIADEARRSPFPPHHATGSRYLDLTDDAMDVPRRRVETAR